MNLLDECQHDPPVDERVFELPGGFVETEPLFRRGGVQKGAGRLHHLDDVQALCHPQHLQDLNFQLNVVSKFTSVRYVQHRIVSGSDVN